MRRSHITTATLLWLAGAALAVSADAAKPERTLERSWPAAEIASVRLDLSVAELEVSAGDSDQIRVEVLAICKNGRDDCEKALAELELTERRRGDALRIELEGHPKWAKNWISIEASVEVPASLAFELDMGVGEVNVEGLEGDLDLELGVGEVTIDAKSKFLRTVSLDVGVGEAEIYGADERIQGRRSFVVGSEVYWSAGKGAKRIDVEVGVGEVTVRLD